MRIAGALLYWSGGSIGVIIYMLAHAAAHFQIQEQLIRHLGGRGAMTKEEKRRAETEAEICDLLEAGFSETKHCRTEQQRQEHGTGVALVSPARDSSMIAVVVIVIVIQKHQNRRQTTDGGTPQGEFESTKLRQAKPNDTYLHVQS